MVPIVMAGHQPWAMFRDLAEYDWVLPVQHYHNLTHLLDGLEDGIMMPALKANRSIELRRTNRPIE